MATGRIALTRDGWLALGAAALAFAVYLATLPPSYGMWDTAELQTVAAILGIAHPPGSPAFTLLGYAVVHLVPFGEAAWRVNAMCSFAVAVSVALAYLTARELGASRLPSLIGAFGFAFALVPWRDATRAEVQDLALCLRAAALFFGVRWCASGVVRDAAMMTLCAGLACATHGLSLFLLPPVALLFVGGRGWTRPAALAAAAGGFAAGLLPYAYVPLRSSWIDAHHLDPMLALGLPRGLPFWNYDDPSTWNTFVHFVTGADFHVAGGFAGYLAAARYPEYAATLKDEIAGAYGYAGTMCAIGGAFVLLSSRRIDRFAIVLAALLPVPYAVAYPDLQDRDRYYLLALWCAALALALAFDGLVRLFALRAKSAGRYALAFALVATFFTVGSERTMLLEQRHDLRGPDYVADVRRFTPDDAIVLADWSYATPLAYAGYVDRAIGHRSVVAASAQQYLAYAARWVRRRPVYFVGFTEDLKLPGWRVRCVKSGTYFAYRLTR